jgi:hypothetical protein
VLDSEIVSGDRDWLSSGRAADVNSPYSRHNPTKVNSSIEGALPIGTPKIIDPFIHQSIDKEEEKEMTKPIKALGMALFAAVAMLAARRPKSAAAEYEEFDPCSLAEEFICSGVPGGYMKRATSKVSESIQIAFVELVEVRESLQREANKPMSLQRELNKPITLGTKCYVGHRYSLDTEKLTASLANSKNKTPSECRDKTTYANSNNINATNFSYEKTQLNSCLA